MEVNDNEGMGGIDALVEDRVRGESVNMAQREEAQNFDKLLDDAKRVVYPGCKDFTLLKFVISILNVKVMNNWSTKSLDMILEFLVKLLPKGNLAPRSTYEAKKILHDLGMSYELIDVCKNNCTLFSKEIKDLDKCPKCDESEYRLNNGKGKKIPH